MLRVFRLPEVRNRILFCLLVIVIFRLLAHIPVPGVDVASIRAFLESSALFGFLDLFSGGSFQNFSIATLGVGPYINASIVFQLLTVMIPSLEELSKEGQYGRERINQYTKYATVPLAMLQAYGVYFLLSKQGVIESLDFLSLTVFLFSLTSGTVFLMWLGDLVTEYGMGNGVSILIFVGIVSRLPASITRFFFGFNLEILIRLLTFLVISLIVIFGIVLVNEGTRNINIEYGRRGGSSAKVTNFLPIKINQAGVIPIIFAVSVAMIPSLISGPLSVSSNDFLQRVGGFLSTAFNNTTVFYNVVYFLLVVGFTYFYTAVQFDSEKIADDIKKRGGFIPGIRPGRATAKYLGKIISRITLVGALFLGVVAVLPYIIQSFIGISNLAIGGTGILIVVSVVLETIRQIESMMATRNYESFI